MPVIDAEMFTVSYAQVRPPQVLRRPVVLLHSSAAGCWQWRPMLPHLGNSRVVAAPDLIGYGRTADRSERAFSMEREVEAVALLLHRLAEPAHIVGHSYGGCVAMALAEHMPTAVRTLTLIEPVRFDLLGDAHTEALLAEIETLAVGHIAAVADRRFDAAARAFTDYWNGAGTWASLPPKIRETIVDAMPKVAQEWALLFDAPSNRARPSAWTGPCLLIEGASTTPAAKAVIAALASRCAQADIARIPGAGHLSPITHAQEVADPIRRFVEAHD